MSLDDLVNVSISAQTNSPTRPGFGTPLIAAYHTHFSDLSRTYNKPADMVSDGFLVTDPAYLAASAVCAQNPKPAKFKIGRRALKPVQSVQLKCLSAVAGDVYKITVNATSVSYTVPSSGSPTTTTVATAIAALIATDPIADATAAVDTITVVVQGSPTPASAYLNDFKDWTANFELTDATPDPGVAADLAAIFAFDSDWYGLALDSNSKAEVEAAASWTESNKRLFVTNNSDIACTKSSSTTDVMAAMKTSAYARTIPIFAGTQLLCYSGAAALGKNLPFLPGSRTWAYKTLAGVPADIQSRLSPTQYNNLLAKNANVYVPVAGVNVMLFGKSSAGEFADVTHFIDWLQAEIQIRVFTRLVNTDKIPFTDAGVDQVKSSINGALITGVNRGGLAPGSTSISAPAVADVSEADRASRNLPDVSFGGRLAGAIHTLQISGTLTV